MAARFGGGARYGRSQRRLELTRRARLAGVRATSPRTVYPARSRLISSRASSSAAFVLDVPGMALEPPPLDPWVPLAGGVQTLPQVLILDRLLVGGAPAALTPALDPLGDALAQILAVGEQAPRHRPLQRLECRDRRHQLHAVVGRQRLAAGQLAALAAPGQDRTPAAWAGIAAAGAVGVDLDRRLFRGGFAHARP